MRKKNVRDHWKELTLEGSGKTWAGMTGGKGEREAEKGFGNSQKELAEEVKEKRKGAEDRKINEKYKKGKERGTSATAQGLKKGGNKHRGKWRESGGRK